MGKYLDALRKAEAPLDLELTKPTKPSQPAGSVSFGSALSRGAPEYNTPSADPLSAYLATLSLAAQAELQGLPPTPYSAATVESWRAWGLHGDAWAAWWNAVWRQRHAWPRNIRR